MALPKIVKVESFVPSTEGSGGDYHRQSTEHWIVQGNISNPMSMFPEYAVSRTSWGIGVLGSLFVKVTAEDGTVGYATGFGGPAACWLIEEHLKRFVVGKSPAQTNLIWEQMYRGSLFYGRKGIPMLAISVVDLAIWDLLGKLLNQPVMNLIGGRTKEYLPLYLTSNNADYAESVGFIGSKVPLPHGPHEGEAGLRKNVEFLRKMRNSIKNPDHFLSVDCYMSLDVNYAVKLAQRCIDEKVDIKWWEEVLSPDDVAGHKLLKERMPTVTWTTGEHEYNKVAMRELIEHRAIDIIQADVMWVGGLTELIKINAMCEAYGAQVVPHGSGPYSYHAVMSFPNSHFSEYICNSPDGRAVLPCFGDLFLDEPVPTNGRIDIDETKPGFGLTLNPEAKLIPFSSFFTANPSAGPKVNGQVNGEVEAVDSVKLA